MGNQESKNAPQPQERGATSASASAPTQASATQHGTEKARSIPRRRESIHTGITGAKASASPSASLTSATAIPNPSKESAKDTLKKAAPPVLSSPTPHLKPVDATATDSMGASSSKPIPVSATDKAALKEDNPSRHSTPLPIDVPAQPPPADDDKPLFPPIVASAAGFGDSSFLFHSPSQFTHPPRLPLPIESEKLAPGSPIISPEDISVPIGPIEGELPRKASTLSSTTVEDDDDVGDDAAIAGSGPLPTIPTVLEWREGGERVYVTGTFAGWDKKYRLTPDGPSKHEGALSCFVNLMPGTHHVRFIVDGDSKLSKYMPTAVDFTNFLVNYVEVAAPDMPIADEDIETLKLPPSVADDSRPGSQAPQAPTAAVPTAPGPKPEKTLQASQTRGSSETLTSQAEKLPKSAPIKVMPKKEYHTEVPLWLKGIEMDESDSRYQRSSQIMSTLPSPPSLPMFLGKSVLNGSTPMKDDASVLNMPNHTVLNHLATASIRNKVLATSATTRYKRKFLTTILYKPTVE